MESSPHIMVHFCQQKPTQTCPLRWLYRKIKSVEFMACDALALAAEPLGLLEAVGPQADIENYINLDDSILQRIKLLDPERYEHPRNVEKVGPICR